MKHFLIIVPCVFVVALMTMVGCALFEKNPDSIPEEILEEVIEQQFHIDLDLSPGSPEK